MFGTYILLGITHETEDTMIDSFNLEQFLTETLFKYYGNEKAVVSGAIRIPSKEITEEHMDDNLDDIKTFIDNVIRCDEEE